MVPANVGNENTFVRGNSGTVIDFTLGSSGAISQISNWRVHGENILDSDHRLIQMQIHLGEKNYEISHNLSKVNWNAFRRHLDDALKDIGLDDLERAVNKINNAILDILDSLAPLRESL